MNIDISTLRKNAAPPPPAEADTPAGFVANFGAAWDQTTVAADTFGYEDKLRLKLFREGYDRLSPEGRAEFTRQTNGRKFYDPLSANIDLMLKIATGEAKTAPQAWGDFPLDPRQFQDRIDQTRQKEYADAQAILDRPGGGFAAFLGSTARSVVDPMHLMTLPLGFEGVFSRLGLKAGLARTMASEGLANAAAEGAGVPRERAVATDLGLAEPSLAGRLAEGGLVGATFAGVLHGAARGLQYLMDRQAMTRAGAPPGTNPMDHEADVVATRDRLYGQQTPAQSTFDQKVRVATGVPSMADFDFSPAGNASPKTNRVGYVYGKLLAKGYSPEDASALVGNFMVEAGPALHPGAIGDGGRALGIAQWNDRRPLLEEFARKRGTSPDDLDTQIDFVDYELRGPEAEAWAAIRRAKTAEEKAALVSQLYERPGLPRLESRVGFARALQEQFNSGRIPRWEGGAPDLSAEVPRFTTSRGYTGEGQISTPSGRRIDVRYEVVDASILKRATGDLQPRDRSRAASDAWIKETAARLDPAQLMPSPNAATGTPIVGPDNVIESGNGRFGAISHAYEHFPDRGAAYRQSIESFTGEPIPAGVTRPVLVAKRLSELTPAERRSFVVDAQDAGVMRMSAAERANTSAKALTPDLMARFDPGQDMFDPANGDVVRGMIAALPQSEHNAMTDAVGALSGEGRVALKQAMFARAWPAGDMIGRIIEGDPGEMKSLMGALDQAAPHWAVLRAEIEAGRVRADADISPFVLEAMRLIASARDGAARDGRSVAEAVAELMNSPDLMEGALSPVTLDLLTRKFWKDGRAAPEAEITDFLTRYATEARKVATTEASLVEAPTTAAILRQIDGEVFRDLPEDIGTPRDVVLRGQALPNGPPMAEDAYAKGADSPEAEAADTAALEGLGTGAANARTPMSNLSGIEPDQYVRHLALDQPFDNMDAAYELAAEAQARLAAEGERIAREMGIVFKDPGLKDRSEAEGKLVRKGYNSPRQLTDISRGGFVVGAPAQSDELVRRLAERFDLIDEGWVQKAKSNYLDRKVILRHPDGMLSEVQVWTPEVFKAKTAETAAYTAARDLDPESEEVRMLMEQSAAAYSAAIRRDNIDVASLIPAGTSIEPKLVLKRSANSASEAPPAVADRQTSSASTLTQSPPGSSRDTARNPLPGAVTRMAGLPSQERKLMSSVIGENPSVKDTFNMGASEGSVNTSGPADYEFSRAIAEAKASFGDVTVPLAEGIEVRAADLLDQLEKDQQLSEYLNFCNPGGQS